MNLSPSFRARAIALAMIGIQGLAAAQVLSSEESVTPDYVGPGLEQPLHIPGIDLGQIDEVATGHFVPGPGGVDMAILMIDGTLYVRPGFRYFAGYEIIATDAKSIAILDKEARDQLIYTNGSDLFRLDWPSGGPYSWNSQSGGNPGMGGELLETIRSGIGNKSGFAVISSAGDTVGIFTLDSAGIWTKEAGIEENDVGQGNFYDVAVGEFTSVAGTGQVALITDHGLTFRNFDGTPAMEGGSPIPTFSGAPSESFVQFLTGDGFASGRDAVVRQFRWPGVGLVAEVIHSGHYEVFLTEGLGLRSFGFVDFQGDGHKDLVLPTSFGELFVATNSGDPNPTQALFAVNYDDRPAQISLNDEPNDPAGIPPGAQTFCLDVDLDFDGVGEMVAVGPRGTVFSLGAYCDGARTPFEPLLSYVDVTGTESHLAIDKLDTSQLLSPGGNVDYDVWIYEYQGATLPLNRVHLSLNEFSTVYTVERTWSLSAVLFLYFEAYVDGHRWAPNIGIWTKTGTFPSGSGLGENSPWAPVPDPGEAYEFECRNGQEYWQLHWTNIPQSAVTGGTPPRPTPGGEPFEGDDDGGRGGD